MAESYYQEGHARAERVRRLFTRIARRYDLLNDLQSLGLHRLWKRRLVAGLPLTPGNRVLDLACGTGDLAFRMLQTRPSARVFGGDFTLPMLRVAQSRIQNPESRIQNPPAWVNLDALALPFEDGVFDAVMTAYGLRNMADPARALREIARVLKPGGTAAILDFSRPPHPCARALNDFMLTTVQPLLGWLFFRDSATYRYIHESLMHYPPPGEISRMLGAAGFAQVACRNLFLGIMTLHVAGKKETP